jgi:hypothetical protein
MDTPQQQFQAIQSMLAAGHRSVRLERHSLLLLGSVGGFLSVVTGWVITAERFPDTGQQGVALLLWLGFWLGGASVLEVHLTRRARARRAETLPFAQTQITRAWWMLLGVGCLGSFAMFFHGGGGMIYALWTVLLGLGVYLFGLFSRRLVEWIGLAMILLGIAGLGSGLPYDATRWINAACFAIGMPLAGWLDARVGESGLGRRVAALAVWLVLVVTPALLVVRLHTTSAPEAVTGTVATPDIAAGAKVLHLPAGSRVPLRVDLESDILAIAPDAEMEMTLRLPVDVALRDGRPDGRFRLADGHWHEVREGALSIRIDRLSPGLEHGQPVVRAQARLHQRAPEGLAR